MIKEAGYSRTAVYINELSSPRGEQNRGEDNDTNTEDDDDALSEKTGSWDEYRRIPHQGKTFLSRPFNAYIVASIGE